jgi:hypothetical protein
MNRFLPSLLFLGAAACIRAPEIVVVDRATALEEQAAGSFEELEQKLTRSGIAPRPVPLTPEQLESLGIHPAPLVNSAELTDADRLDRLLRQHCVGEGRDGLLVDTHESCRGAADAEAALRLIERVNRARAQLWNWMQVQRPAVTREALRGAWREVHLRGVVCGGWTQREDGAWEAKKCG